jgi:general L-amino acid transport system permease protein
VTIDAASGVTRPRRPPPWNDPRIRSIFYQILFVAVIAALGAFLIHNTLVNLRRQNIASGFGFLDREAAFGIGESLIAYSPADTYARAFWVGLVNTLYVSALGIVLATMLGAVMGIARLSSNWLIRKLAQVYVETFRNIPLLL